MEKGWLTRLGGDPRAARAKGPVVGLALRPALGLVLGPALGVGLALAAVLFSITTHLAHLSMDLSFPLGLFVLLLSIAMCSISGLASLRKVQGADPADLFR